MAKIIPVRKARQALLKKGFEERKGEGDHDYFYLYDENGKRVIRTYFSRGAKTRDLSHPLLASIKQQLKLDTINEVVDLFECPLDEEAYRNKLRGKGELK